MNIYIVRHAQSRGNVEDQENHPYLPEFEEYEFRDPSLTVLGRKQADLCGQRLSQVNFDHIFIGPLHRHFETAYGIIRHQKKCKTVEVLHDLTETDHESRTIIPIDIYNKVFPEMEIIPPTYPQKTGGPAPDGYTEDDKTADGYLRRAHRVDRFLHDNFDSNANILLVTSSMFGGCVLMPVMMGASDEEVNGSMPYDLCNASISLIKYGHWDFCGDFSSCEFANDVAHLIVPESVDISKLPLPNRYPAWAEKMQNAKG